MPPVRRLPRSAVLAFVVLAFAGAASAQEPAPESNAYEQARRAFKEQRYRDAALGFEAVFRIRPDAIALYTAAQAWSSRSIRPVLPTRTRAFSSRPSSTKTRLRGLGNA
jgi:hypothetical protein